MIVCGVDDKTAPAVARFASELASDLSTPLLLARADRRGHAAVDMATGVAVEVPSARSVAAPEGIAAESRVEVGRPADVLARVAAEEEAELIVVGSRGRGPVAATLLGSVSRALLRSAPCGVAIVTPLAAERLDLGTNGRHGPIVCGIDGSERALAGAHFAAGLAQRLGERLLLCHVRDYPATGAPHRRSENDVVGAAVRALDADVEIAIEEGPAAHALQSLTARTRARMVVVAPRGVHGLRETMLGSVSSFLARSAPCPLVVPAPG